MDIYVGNLPYDTDDSILRTAFAAYGTVDAVKIIIDHETGRSKGFAFVTMSDNEEGRKAIEELDGSDVNGRAMKVNEARPREDRPRGGGGGGGGRGGFGGGGGGGRGGFGGGGGGGRGGFGGGGGGRGRGHGGGRGRDSSRGGDPDWR